MVRPPMDPDELPDLPHPPGPSGACPALIGRYVQVREIGRGGTGRVVEAEDPNLGRRVAVKVVLDPQELDPKVLAQVAQEARILARLQHPGIVPVYDLGTTDDGRWYFVMKRLDGEPLSDVLTRLRQGDPHARATWTRRRLLSAFVQCCQAVAFAHTRGVLHRDLKPSNILLGDYGEVVVLDWGSAIERDTIGDQLGEGEIAVGTVGYMSPEAAREDRERLDERADVWSLGAVLYELLTYTRAYPGDELLEVLYASLDGPPQDPRERAPDLKIPQDLAELCLSALDPDPMRRPPAADALAVEVEAFLEGGRRREQALRHMEEARRLWARHEALAAERSALQSAEREVAARVAPWTPLAEKGEWIRLRDRIAEIEPRRAAYFSDVVAACERALSQDPDLDAARELLARVYWARFVEAEARDDATSARFFSGRVQQYGGPTWVEQLRGVGTLTLKTDPPGARVIARRVQRHGLPWALGEPLDLGRTPLVEVALEQGSWVLTIEAPGYRPTTYPVLISRDARWDSGRKAVPLLTEEELGPDFVYVPAGPFRAGGDHGASHARHRSEPWVDGFLIGVHEVTADEYLEFVEDLRRSDAGAAWERVPRRDATHSSRFGQFWVRPEPGGAFTLPDPDPDGDRWDPEWPVFGVDWGDAIAFAEWRSRREGARFELPTDLEWEKAARGVDGRIFPWGDSFDPTLCLSAQSLPGRPQVQPVGSFTTDRSVYGAYDMAGSMREWVADPAFDGDTTRRGLRGGCWQSQERGCRVAARSPMDPWEVYTTFGFRLVKRLDRLGGRRTHDC